MTHIAFDVHQATSTYAYLDPSSQQPVVGRILTDCASFTNLLGDLPVPWIVALEATRSTPAICTWLRQLDCAIHLVDPQKLSGLAQARSAKTDRRDALLMLDALAHDYLPEAYLADPQVQRLRELTRAHWALVRMGTMLRNLLRGMMARAGKLLAATNLCGVHATEELGQWLATVEAPYNLLGALYVSLLQQVRQATAAVDEQIKHLADHNPLAQELLSQPGKGLLTTMGMLAEMGDLARFSSVKQLLSYSGLAPSVQQSGEKSRTGRLPQRCNKHLRYWAVMCAQATVHSRHPSRAKEVYLRVKSRHGANAAKIAAAREIVKDVYYAYRRLQQSQATAA
ncbi:MAG: IS110 family transposase [Armatimonadia bacterium]